MKMKLESKSGRWGVCWVIVLGVSGNSCRTLSDSTTLDSPDAHVHYIESGSDVEIALLNVVNRPQATEEYFDEEVGLNAQAARNLAKQRQGADGLLGSSDDHYFRSVEEVDEVPYVGPSALMTIVDYAQSQGMINSTEAMLAQHRVDIILAVVNGPGLSLFVLDEIIALNARSAMSIWEFRQGPDAQLSTEDDGYFEDLDQLDALLHIGEASLSLILAYGIKVHAIAPLGALNSVSFSPQPYALSHLQRTKYLIAQARDSVDVAIYSLWDQSMLRSLGDASHRGVRVRVLFESAKDDRKSDEPHRTKSGSLEELGIDVRYVNKIMHHKFVLIDGPRDALDRANTGILVTGSANWSWSAATRFDDNTLFLKGHPDLLIDFQREFNLMWEHSRDFDSGSNIGWELSSQPLPSTCSPNRHNEAWWTSDNFEVQGDTFRLVSGQDTVVDALVDSIMNAQHSIRVASGHFRSRKIAEALSWKFSDDPTLDIRIYLDGQEFVDESEHAQQQKRRSECLISAGESEARRRRCNDRGFMYSYGLSQQGIDLRFKYYAYHWHYSYAPQMHHKYILIDDQELWTGSYNLSDNSEHQSFENVLHFWGESFSPLVTSFIDNFEAIWSRGEDEGRFDDLIDDIESADDIKLVFEPISLAHKQVEMVKEVIYERCPEVESEPFSNQRKTHQICTPLSD
jgi:phosphatidylserine/phosphatidylglycerophosphate/cardiolipin synthase-like enzyme